MRPSDLPLVNGILAMLHQFLSDCVDVAEQGLPIDKTLQNVDSALENLALMAVSVQQTGRRSRLQKADRMYDP